MVIEANLKEAFNRNRYVWQKQYGRFTLAIISVSIKEISSYLLQENAWRSIINVVLVQ